MTLALSYLLSACGEQVSRTTPDWFIAPTVAQKAAPIVLNTPTNIPPSPTPDCDADLSFVSDLTIPDNSLFPPSASIEKVWLVENSGSCNWDQRYRVRFIDGDLMSAPTEIALFPARSGTDAEIKIIFTTPPLGGVYQTFWQAYTPEGEPFGQIFYMLIEVDPDLVPTASPGDDGTPNSRPDTGENN